MSITEKRVGLSLSGGGYRATAFHLGTLNKLHQLGVLQQIDIISTISGGSITGAYYCLNKDNYDAFSQSLYNAVQQKSVIKKVLLSATFFKLLLFVFIFLGSGIYFLFTNYAWLFPIFLVIFFIFIFKFQFYIFPISKRIEKIYDEFFYKNNKLSNLPIHPTLVIGSTNLETSRPFTFAKDWMQDSTYQYMKPPITFKAANFPISRAVMASSCVPFAFTPIKIDKEFFENEKDYTLINPILVDGGVYDNQGIHKIMQQGKYSCTHLITSDAGSGTTDPLKIKNTISLLVASFDTFMSRIKKAQMIQDVYENAGSTKKQIAYFSLAWDVENCIKGFINNLADKQITQSVIEALQIPTEWVAEPKKFENELTVYLAIKINYEAVIKPTDEEKRIARKVGTNLTALNKQQVDCLIKQAECLTEIQVKLYCPSLIKNV